MELIEIKNIKLGLIGLGYVGKIHLRNSLNLRSAQLTAVSDVSRKALAYARRMGVKERVQDYQKLFERSNIDAVVIALPTHLHKKCAIEAADAGKDILLEKPLARNPEEGKEIVRSAEKNDVKLMVGYHLKFSPEFRGLKQQLLKGSFGEVQSAFANFVGTGPFMHRAEGHIPRPVPSWWFDKGLTGGGAVMDLGCHLISLMRWYFGEIVVMKGYLGHRFGLDFEDYAICIARFKSGLNAVIHVGWFSLDYSLRVELFGTVKNVCAERKPPNKILHAIQLLTGKSKFYLPHFWELEHFVHCVRNDVTPISTGTDALKDLEAISEAYANSVQLDQDSGDKL